MGLWMPYSYMSSIVCMWGCLFFLGEKFHSFKKIRILKGSKGFLSQVCLSVMEEGHLYDGVENPRSWNRVFFCSFIHIPASLHLACYAIRIRLQCSFFLTAYSNHRQKYLQKIITKCICRQEDDKTSRWLKPHGGRGKWLYQITEASEVIANRNYI